MSKLMNVLAAFAALGIDVPLSREVNVVKVERTELPAETIERCRAERIKAAEEKRARKAAKKGKQA